MSVSFSGHSLDAEWLLPIAASVPFPAPDPQKVIALLIQPVKSDSQAG